ncbi:MAG: hypothetical protein H5T92_09535, partial [Synergistales bacterium]|nr:hypothetical protein [Synergistales bacterium]
MKLAAATLLGMSKEVKNHFAQRGWLANLADRTYTPLYDRAPVIARTKRSPVAPGAIPEDPFSWSYNRKTKRYLSEMKRTRLPKGKRRSLFEKWLDQMKGYRWGNIRAYVASEDPMWNFFFNRYKEPWTPEKVRFLRLLYRHTKNPNGLDELFWFLADLTEEEEPEMLQAVESPIEDILNECPLPLVVPAEDIFEIDFQEYGWVQVRTLTNDLALVNFRFLDDQISAPNGIPLGIASQKDIYRSTAIVLGFTTHIHGIDRFCEG